MFDTTGRILKSFFQFLRAMMSEADGTVSVTRSLMAAFSFFSMWLIWRIFWHIFHLHDLAQLTMWISNIPILIASFCGLIALPYTINKGAGAITDTFSGIANLMAQKNTTVQNQLNDLLKAQQGNNQGQQGTPQEKG